MNKIVVNLGNFKLDEIPLHRGTINIGRAADNFISLADPATSSHHAKIVTIFTSSFIQDLNSTNGTIVNGRKVVRHTLHHGDIIAIGNLQLLFKSHDGVTAEASKETILIDKKASNIFPDKKPGEGQVVINKALKEAAENQSPIEQKEQLSGFSITMPKAGANDTNIDPDMDTPIPTLDETLPLDELRKDPARTVVITPNEIETETETEAEPDEQEGNSKTEFLSENVDFDDVEIEEIELSELEDTAFLEEDESARSIREQELRNLLMSDDLDAKSKILAKYAIGISILVILTITLYLLI